MTLEEVADRLAPTGMCGADIIATTKHLLRADELGIHDQGVSRLEWLAEMRFSTADPPPRIMCEQLPYTDNTWIVRAPDRIGYALMEAAVAFPFPDVRTHRLSPYMVVVDGCFPSGALGVWARELADWGYASLITATSKRRVPHPGGGAPFIGTTPICVCIPDKVSKRHLVADLALTDATYGDVLAGDADESQLRFPTMKLWALGLALETLVRTMSYQESAVFMLLFRPVRDDTLRLERANSRRRLPGERK